MCTVTLQNERTFDFLCHTPHDIILYCWYKCWVGSETQCLLSTSMVSSHLLLSENSNMFHWVSSVLCCGSLVQDESERGRLFHSACGGGGV